MQALSATQVGLNTTKAVEHQALVPVSLQSSATTTPTNQLWLITTPIQKCVLRYLLAGYKNHNFIIDGISRGFSIGYSGPLFNCLSRNHKSAVHNPLVVSVLLDEEIKCCRIAGPFNTIPFPNAFISPFGLIPKKVAGLFRLIHDLSFPKGNSVNDGIPQNLHTVHYESFDDAINYILSQGPGVRLMKCDIKSVYPLIPVCPSDRPLLGFQWADLHYFDKSLTMGLASAYQIFECFSSSIKFILIRYIYNVFIVKILDNFLVITSSQHVCPISAYVTLLAIFKALDIPLAEDKCMPPCRSHFRV